MRRIKDLEEEEQSLGSFVNQPSENLTVPNIIGGEVHTYKEQRLEGPPEVHKFRKNRKRKLSLLRKKQANKYRKANKNIKFSKRVKVNKAL